jgi:hypothetical protein
MSNKTLQDSQAITFEDAIAQTQALLEQVENQTITNRDLEQALTALVSSENGARGFFVTYLPDERSLADQPSPEVLAALQSSPAIVTELLVKNLAMSTAMGVYHRRNQDEGNAQGSDRVQVRTLGLMQRLSLPDLRHKARALLTSACAGSGEYQAFLDRWGYDPGQRQTIQQILEQFLAA